MFINYFTNMFKKIIGYFSAFLLSILLLSFILGWIYQGKIKEKAISEINKKLEAKVQIEDISVGIFSSFPNANIQLQNLKIIGINEFKNDTLANIPKFNLEINLWKFITANQVIIKEIVIDQAKIKLHILKNGNANWDISKKTTQETQTSESPLQIALQSYQISESEIIYNDESRKFETHLKGLNHLGKGDFQNEIFELQTETEVENWDLAFLGKPIFSGIRAQLEAPISMNLKQMEFKFKNNTLQLNTLPIEFSYSVAMPDENMNMDLTFKAAKTDIKNLFSIIPSLYKNDFEKLKASGNFQLNGSLNGILNDTQIPNFNIKLALNNANLAYEGKPDKISNLQVGFEANNPTGKVENTEIHIAPFSTLINQNKLNGELHVQHPTGDPILNGNLKGDFELQSLQRFFSKEDLSYSGKMYADIQFDGQLSQLKKGKGKVLGKAIIENFKGKYQNQSLEMAKLIGNFSPQKVQIQTNINYLQTLFNVKGSIENVFGYLIKGEDFTSKVGIDVKSLSIPKAFENIDLVKKYLPIAGSLQGDIATSFNFSGNFNSKLDLIIPSVNAEGILNTGQIEAKGSEILNKIITLSSWKGQNQISLNPTKMNFVIKDGFLIFKPFNIHTNFGQFAVSGKNGLNQSLAYSIQTEIPVEKLGNKWLTQLNEKFINLIPGGQKPTIKGNIPFEINISGTIPKPLIQAGLSKSYLDKFNAKDIQQAIQNVVKSEIKKQKNKALEEAQRLADQEMAKAREEAERIKGIAYAEADKLVEQAGNPLAKFAAQKLAEKLKREADKKVEKLLQDAQVRANERIEKAKSLE